jgi:hypothetical protein
LIDLRRSRVSTGLFLDMVLDARKHAENVRRSTDGAFRLRDEVWTEVDVEVGPNGEPKEPWDGPARKYKLE